ncbi:flagellar export chaperone FlgN [Clostridium paraputrificum]|uniref:flagellar export chaperone FlgN n=1 Tax=Clostridium TaxID=1485 RepID=UPI003D32A8A0
MVHELIDIIRSEELALSKLLSLLEEQYKHIMEKNVFELDGMVEKIKLCNKEIAEEEVRRRKLVGTNSMKEVVRNYKDENLDNAYRDIKKLIEVVTMQKETNELLIRQQMSFNAQILNIINPRREIKTYNSYGNLSR